MASFLEGAISTYRVQGERLAREMALNGGFSRQGNPTSEGRGTSRRSCHRSVVQRVHEPSDVQTTTTFFFPRSLLGHGTSQRDYRFYMFNFKLTEIQNLCSGCESIGTWLYWILNCSSASWSFPTSCRRRLVVAGNKKKSDEKRLPHQW